MFPLSLKCRLGQTWRLTQSGQTTRKHLVVFDSRERAGTVQSWDKKQLCCCWYAQSQQGRWETFSFSRILQLRSSSSLSFNTHSHRLRKASPHTQTETLTATQSPATYCSSLSARRWNPQLWHFCPPQTQLETFNGLRSAWERDGDKLQCLVWWGGQKQWLGVWLGSWAATSSLYVPLYVHVHVQMRVRVYACIHVEINDVLILFNVHVFSVFVHGIESICIHFCNIQPVISLNLQQIKQPNKDTHRQLC